MARYSSVVLSLFALLLLLRLFLGNVFDFLAQVKSRQLWGEDIYTDDSDLVAVLLHLGYYASNNTASNPLVSRFYAQISLLPPQEQYYSCFRNAVRSRGWFSKIEGCSYKVCESACRVRVAAVDCLCMTLGKPAPELLI